MLHKGIETPSSGNIRLFEHVIYKACNLLCALNIVLHGIEKESRNEDTAAQINLNTTRNHTPCSEHIFCACTGTDSFLDMREKWEEY